MRATTHALTGAAIGFLIRQPLAAIPLSVASHFVCDALPHFDKDTSHKASWHRSKTFKRALVADTIGCLVLVSYLAFNHPVHWLLAVVCAFMATSPDLLWINR